MGGEETVELGLIAAGEVPEQLAGQLAQDLPAVLHDSVSAEVGWNVPVVSDSLAADVAASATSMIDAARDRMLREGWDLAVCITDLPLRNGRRPVVADASATHGVALVSLPALGAMQLRRRAREAVVRLVDGLVGESLEMAGHDDGRRARVDRRLRELAAPVRLQTPEDDDDVDLRFVAAVVRGNLRLLAGMVRANRPWRVIAGLSRALAAALAAVVFALVTSDIWQLADALGAPRLAALTAASVVATVVALIVSHGLWEQAHDPAARERAVLFNVATTLTLALGVLTLYVALLALTLAGAELMVDDSVLSQALAHETAFADRVELAWMVASVATVGGALGSALESDGAVRAAAYGYRPEHETVRGRGRVDAA